LLREIVKKKTEQKQQQQQLPQQSWKLRTIWCEWNLLFSFLFKHILM
jgi:hypothetical protein